jgi:hypothetical protein
VLDGLDAIDWTAVHGAYGRPPGFRWHAALDLLAELGPAAAEALADLRAAADHPRCPFVTDLDSSRDRWLGHHDDAFVAATRAAITAIERRPDAT